MSPQRTPSLLPILLLAAACAQAPPRPPLSPWENYSLCQRLLREAKDVDEMEPCGTKADVEKFRDAIKRAPAMIGIAVAIGQASGEPKLINQTIEGDRATLEVEQGHNSNGPRPRVRVHMRFIEGKWLPERYEHQVDGRWKDSPLQPRALP